MQNSNNNTVNTDAAKIWWDGLNENGKILAIRTESNCSITEAAKIWHDCQGQITDEKIAEIYLSCHLSEHPSPTVNKEAEEHFDWNLYPGNESGAFDHLDNAPIEYKPLNSSVELFTQGEWEVRKSLDKEYPFEILNTSEFTTLAKVTNLNKNGSAEANAKLISQAPAMLRALKGLLDAYSVYDNSQNEERKTAYNQARAIINSIQNA